MTTLPDPTPSRDATQTHLLACALHLAARGWYVFPVTPGAKKPPVIDRWEARASTDPDQIHRWWHHIPYNVGIATGPSGLVVIDLDTAKAGQPVPGQWAELGINSGSGVLRALAHQRGTTITPTYTVRTPSVINGSCGRSLHCLRRPALRSILLADSLLSAGLHRRDATATVRSSRRCSGPREACDWSHCAAARHPIHGEA